MLRMLAEYSHHMDKLIKQREAELHSDKMRVEDMLYSILPRFLDRPHFCGLHLCGPHLDR